MGMLMMSAGISRAQQTCPNGPSNVSTAQDLPRWSSRDASLIVSTKTKEYLYFDSVRGEVVAFFPNSLNDSDASSAEWTEFRWQPQLLVIPTIVTTVHKLEGDWYEYQYLVGNGSSAKKDIAWFTIVAVASDSTLTLSHPTWKSYGSNPVTPSVAPSSATMDGEHIREPGNLGRFVSWFSGGKELNL